MEKYDSRPDTFRHIQEVQKQLNLIVKNLIDRGEKHDQSKLISPEVEIFDEFTPKLKDSEYGSDEYKNFLKDMTVGLEHHYKENMHHPEHWKNGIKDMSLIDLIEMLSDWISAVKRHSTGNIYKSIEINQKRFGYSDELKQILVNTVKELEK